MDWKTNGTFLEFSANYASDAKDKIGVDFVGWFQNRMLWFEISIEEIKTKLS